MKRAWMAAALVAGLAAAAGPLAAQSLVVLYLEGSVAQRTDGAWAPLAIGDELPAAASVKLENLALVQLRSPGSAIASITLTQPGTYALRTVLASSASLRSTGALRAAAVGFSRVLSGAGARMDAVGGVRSERVPTEDFMDFGETGTVPIESPAREAVRTARGLISRADYPGAASTLRQALPSASEDDAREVSFYLASALELAGDARGALAALKAAPPRGGEEWARDAVLLGARLLEDSYAWAQARDLLIRAPDAGADDERAPTYFFLLALAYRGTGERDREAAALDRVLSLDPTGELGRTARALRDER